MRIAALTFDQTNQSDLGYADDFVLLSEDPSKFHVPLGRLNDSVGMFEMFYIFKV